MQNHKLFFVIASLLASFAGAVRAGEILEYQFTGVFTDGLGVYPNGSTFTSTLRFDLDSPDLDPLTTRGKYSVLSWDAPGISGSNFSFPPDGTFINISNGAATDSWRLEYPSITVLSYILFAYPNDTFASDALPATIDISASSTIQNFSGVWDGSELRGRITSLTIVPEPVNSVVGMFLGAILRRRR